MGDLVDRNCEDHQLDYSCLRGGKPLLLATILLLQAAAWAPIALMPGVTLAATLPASEFVVPGGPVITLQDGQRIDGHIIGFDQTNVVIRTKEGSEQTLPRATIDHVRFETVTGMEVSGALIGWKPGVYELTTEEAVVTVYSVAPPTPVKDASNQEIADDTVEDDAEPVLAAATVDGGINGAAAAIPEEEIAETDEQVAAVTPASDLEISVAVNNAREDAEAVSFDIELSRPSDTSVVLIYATIDGTAVDGEDYQAARGVLVIKAGQTSARIEAPIIDDDLGEDEEQLRLFLTVDPAVAVVRNREIIATIEDDDQG